MTLNNVRMRDLSNQELVTHLNGLDIDTQNQYLYVIRNSQLSYLFQHYTDLYDWRSLDFFKYIDNPYQVLSKDEMNCLSDINRNNDVNYEENFKPVKTALLPALEYYFSTTGNYDPLLWDMPFDVLMRIYNKQPNILDSFEMLRLSDIFKYELKKVHRSDASKFLFVLHVKQANYWNLLFTSDQIHVFHDLILDNKQYAPDDFLSNYLRFSNLTVTQKEEVIPYVSKDRLQTLLFSGLIPLEHSLERLAGYLGERFLVHYFKDYYIDNAVSSEHAQANQKWINQHFSSRTRLQRDMKKAQQYPTLNALKYALDNKTIDRTTFSHMLLHYNLSLSNNTSFHQTLKALYGISFKQFIAQCNAYNYDPCPETVLVGGGMPLHGSQIFHEEIPLYS